MSHPGLPTKATSGQILLVVDYEPLALHQASPWNFNPAG